MSYRCFFYERLDISGFILQDVFGVFRAVPRLLCGRCSAFSDGFHKSLETDVYAMPRS